jgi:hypothetical protein
LQPIILHARESLYRALQTNRYINVTYINSGDSYTITVNRPCPPQIGRGLRAQVEELASSLYGSAVAPNSVVQMVSALCAIQPSPDQQCLAAKLLGNLVSTRLMFWNRVPLTEMLWVRFTSISMQRLSNNKKKKKQKKKNYGVIDHGTKYIM